MIDHENLQNELFLAMERARTHSNVSSPSHQPSKFFFFPTRVFQNSTRKFVWKWGFVAHVTEANSHYEIP